VNRSHQWQRRTNVWREANKSRTGLPATNKQPAARRNSSPPNDQSKTGSGDSTCRFSSRGSSSQVEPTKVAASEDNDLARTLTGRPAGPLRLSRTADDDDAIATANRGRRKFHVAAVTYKIIGRFGEPDPPVV
jgi:hypothetical protein